MHFCISLPCLSLSDRHPSLSPFTFLPPSLLSAAIGLFGHLSASDRGIRFHFWQAAHNKTQGYGQCPTLALALALHTNTHTSVHVHTQSTESKACSTAWCVETHIHINTRGPFLHSPATDRGSWLLKEIAEGRGNPQLSRGSHGVLTGSDEVRSVS